MGSVQTRRRDPLGIHTALPLEGEFYPLGFPLQIATNSRDVIAAAGEAWRGQTQEFDARPLQVRVRVGQEGPLCQAGTHRKQGHLYTVVSDAFNFANVDIMARFAAVHVSQQTASDHSCLRWFFLESVAYVMLCQLDVVMVHAGCVARGGKGVLLCGASEAGKSTLSYALARAGWTWISDDCACLLPHSADRVAIGRSRQARLRTDAPRLFPELDAYLLRARPTGKIGIELSMDEIPGVVTATRTTIDSIAFIDRREGPPFVQRLSREYAIDRLLADMPVYGGDADMLHEETVRRIAEAPAYRLSYATIEDGVNLLGQI